MRKTGLPKWLISAKIYLNLVYIKEVTEKGPKNPYTMGLPRGCCGNDHPD